ncbi:MAG: dTDP-4-dehydrorhamnose 3,5-epimerase family protein, partial [Moraxellaceae bacterium]|nr:dTDP-4-dehydrorhamnose 3,5-epimerase family protein [Moraxellaceae bacterium]
MRVINTHIPDVLIIEPDVFNDERGFFYESFNAREFAALSGVDVAFVQDNHTRSV